jgi:hypothetical protein
MRSQMPLLAIPTASASAPARILMAIGNACSASHVASSRDLVVPVRRFLSLASYRHRVLPPLRSCNHPQLEALSEAMHRARALQVLLGAAYLLVSLLLVLSLLLVSLEMTP